MAKDSERNQARILFIEHGLSQKEISERLRVTEKTVSNWVNEGGWKALRIAKQSSSDVLVSKYNELLGALLDKRLKYEKQTVKSEDDKAEYTNVIDEMSKVSAMIERLQKDGQVSLSKHIHCLEKYFTWLRNNQPKLLTTPLLESQIEYLDLLADELK